MMDAEIRELSESLVDELVGAVGLPKTPFWHNVTWRVFQGVTTRLATLGISFDRWVANDGLSVGSEWILKDFCNPVPARGVENIPMQGPLLVVSNHPGAYDALVIFSKLRRKDIQWIGTEIPFLKKLPHVRECILFTSRVDILNRMTVMRSAIRHLRAGGTLLYFGAGHRDPDPAVYPGASDMMENWLGGIDFFIKHVPDLRLLPTIVSGVVSKKWARHPITLLRRRQIDKQRLSEFGQVITQLLFPRKLLLSPSISFGPAFTKSEIPANPTGDRILPDIIRMEKNLLREHCLEFGGYLD